MTQAGSFRDSRPSPFVAYALMWAPSAFLLALVLTGTFTHPAVQSQRDLTSAASLLFAAFAWLALLIPTFPMFLILRGRPGWKSGFRSFSHAFSMTLGVAALPVFIIVAGGALAIVGAITSQRYDPGLALQDAINTSAAVVAIWLASFFLLIAPAACILRELYPTAAPPVQLEAFRDARTHNLNSAIRLREDLRIVNAVFAAVLTSTVGSVFFLSGSAAMANPTLGLILFVLLAVGYVADVSQAATLQYLPRRVMMGALFAGSLLLALGNVAIAAGILNRGVTQGFSDDFLIVAGAVGLIVIIFMGLFSRTAWNLMVGGDAEFLTARGWRSRRFSFGDALRRVLGVPTYVSVLATGRKRVTLRFLIASWLGAAAVMAFFLLPAVALVFLMDRGLSDFSSGGMMSLAFAAGAIAIYLFFWVLGWFGQLVARAGQRRAAARYQNVREWDDRRPILYLRSFTIDKLRLRKPPRRTIGRLIGLGARFPTLDEAVLDAAAPYGPVVAIGDPRDPVPPLGAARTFVRGSGEVWQDVVVDLAEASALIIVVVDSTTGVRWEIEHILGHPELVQKTLFLSGPAQAPQARQDDMQQIARALGHANAPITERVLALRTAPGGGIEQLAAASDSGDAYATAINRTLQLRFGSDVAINTRKRQRG